MKIRKTLSAELVHDKEFAMGSIVLELDNKIILVCNDFHHSRKQKVKLIVWLPSERKWVKAYEKNSLTEIMWDYYHAHTNNRTRKAYKANYEDMMRYDRKKKCGSGGSRIYDNSITDYECAKNPLHDFRRCYN